jgi:hypothetical protein
MFLLQKPAISMLFFMKEGTNFLKMADTCVISLQNKWMRAKYGEKLRGYLSEKTVPKILIDFGGYKVFDSATVDTNILLFMKKQQEAPYFVKESDPNYHTAGIKACKIEKDFKASMNLSSYFKNNNIVLRGLKSDSWIISSADESIIKRKIEEIGTPLKDWDIQINYGIKTASMKLLSLMEHKRLIFLKIQNPLK